MRETTGSETSRRLLVVEDNDTTRRRLTTVLRAHGYEVHEAVDGLEALAKVSTVRYDAILLDLVMPRVDGWRFRGTVLRHPTLHAIPTIVVTVQPLRAPDRHTLRTPYILQKPFEDAAVLSLVERACAAAQQDASPHDPDVVRDVDQGLFWSRRGVVACALHAPGPDTERWREDGWSVLRRAATRVTYQCQYCSGGQRPVSRGRRTRPSSPPRETDS